MVVHRLRKALPDLSPLKQEINEILSIRLVNSTRYLLEKLFWLSIAIVGSVYIVHIVQNQLKFWNENAVLITQGTRKLSELKKPAITFCHQGAQKYAFIERFVNYIDVYKTIPKEIYEIRNQAIKLQVLKLKGQDVGDEFCDFRKDEHGMWKALTGFRKMTDKFRKRCLVSYFVNSRLCLDNAPSRASKDSIFFETRVRVFSGPNVMSPSPDSSLNSYTHDYLI